MNKPIKPRIPSHIRPKIKQIRDLSKKQQKLEKQQEKLLDQVKLLSREITDVEESRMLHTGELMKELSGAVPNDVIDKVMEKL